MNLIKRFLRLIIPQLIIHIIQSVIKIYKIRFGRKIENGYRALEFIDYYMESNDLRMRQIENGGILEMHEITRGLGILLLEMSSPVHVLDFGGGGGNLFHAARNLMPKKEFNWVVVETSELVKRIVDRSGDSKFIFGKSQLSFVSSINDALSEIINVDVVIAASALQYISDPYEKLINLIKIGPKVIHISRMPFIDTGHLLSFNQITRLSENGPSIHEAFNTSDLVTNIVYIPNLREFKEIIGQNYSSVITLHESDNAYPNTNHVISQYSIIGYN